MESQEGVGRQSHKSKAKDRTSTTGKDGSQRHSASQKATAGYKVEDKTTWTLLQQQQQHFSTPSSSFYYYHSLTPSIPPPLPSFLHFFSPASTVCQFFSWDSLVHTNTQTHTQTHTGSPIFRFFVVVVFRIATWLSPPRFFVPLCTRLWAIRTFKGTVHVSFTALSLFWWFYVFLVKTKFCFLIVFSIPLVCPHLSEKILPRQVSGCFWLLVSSFLVKNDKMILLI